ncbi:MAG: hypothetical protein LRY26_00930 [Bacilli bacterium]|nr:hypothetical protein [Bacilli bacterium]
MEILLKVNLIENEIQDSYIGKAILIDNVITYEDNVKVIINLNKDKLSIFRSNDQYDINISFNENKITYFLKENNASFNINLALLKTDYYSNGIYIEYMIEDSIFKFKLEYEVL